MHNHGVALGCVITWTLCHDVKGCGMSDITLTFYIDKAMLIRPGEEEVASVYKASAKHMLQRVETKDSESRLINELLRGPEF